MDRETAKETAKGMIETYLRMKGIDTRRNFRCLSPYHSNDNDPSMSLDRARNKVHCFGCGYDGDVFDLVAMDYGLTDQRAIFDKTYEVLGITIDSKAAPTVSAEGALDWNDTIEIDEPYGRTQTGKEAAPANEPAKTAAAPVSASEPAQEPAQEENYTEDYLSNGYYDLCHSRLEQTDYAAKRGLSADVLNRFHIGFDPAWIHPKVAAEGKNPPATPRLIIPTSRNSYLARDAREDIPENQRPYSKSKVGSVRIFNKKALEDTKPCFVVEGEIDAMSIVEVGGNALALGSTSNVKQLLRVLEERRQTQPLIIALDNDAAGEKAALELCSGLDRMGISSYRRNPCGEYKDANEALQKDREALRAAILDIYSTVEREEAEKVQEAEREMREEYQASSNAAYLQSFVNGIGESVNTSATATGFSSLDKVLDGGFYEGLYTIGAITSLGKTTLVMQIADMIAASGHDVLIFSLEMARYELISKSISRHTLQIAMRDNIDTRNAKTARGVTDGKRYSGYNPTERKLIQDAIAAYGTYAEHVFIREGIGDIGVTQIREDIEKHIRCTGHRPFVVLDYLQIVAPYNERASDKQNTDKAVLELKRISRDFKIPVFAVSSLNRANYSSAITMEAFKESGAIEYSSDVLLGLQLQGAGKKNFDPTEEKSKDPRQIELVILKNRQGKVGDIVNFEFYPRFNYFVDKGFKER